MSNKENDIFLEGKREALEELFWARYAKHSEDYGGLEKFLEKHERVEWENSSADTTER